MLITPESQTSETGLGVDFIIPENCVKDKLTLSITKGDQCRFSSSHVLKSIHRLSPVFEITPHDAKPFEKPIQIEFRDQNHQNSDDIRLFVQKDFEEDKILDKWTVISPDKDSPFTFSLRGFSFLFRENEGKCLSLEQKKF